MDILGIFGFVFAATATGVLVYEHHMDVLSGPYIEGREPARIIAAMLEPMFEPVHALVAPRPVGAAADARQTARRAGVSRCLEIRHAN